MRFAQFIDFFFIFLFFDNSAADSKDKPSKWLHQHHRRSSVAPSTWTKYPLVPYYPPLFVVPHISLFSRDEHGRRPVSKAQLLRDYALLCNMRAKNHGEMQDKEGDGRMTYFFSFYAAAHPF